MARPRKQTVDYFPHMCNHGKTIFILEQKYQAKGYAFWFKLLEELGKKEGHYLDFLDVAEIEYFSAKTWVSVTETTEILNLLSELGAIDKELWEQKRIVWCQNFVDNLFSVYDKRTVSAPEKPVSVEKTIVSDVRNPYSRVKDSKVEESKDISEPSSHDDVNKIFDIFYNTVNPSINYGNTTSRKATQWMIDKWGVDAVLAMAEYACSIHGKQYAPTVTTPYQLKEKLSAIKAYKEKQEVPTMQVLDLSKIL
jgi:hypothetical protein